MSPIYAYVCSCENAVERIRKYAQRLDPVRCPDCGEPMDYKLSAHHRQPDGIYSHDENIGDPLLAEKGAAKARGEKWDTSV